MCSFARVVRVGEACLLQSLGNVVADSFQILAVGELKGHMVGGGGNGGVGHENEFEHGFGIGDGADLMLGYHVPGDSEDR